MAESVFSSFEVNPNPPPRPFAVAAWMAMSPDAILAGLADGSIAPPPGAPPEWCPPGLTGPSNGSALLDAAYYDPGMPTIAPPDPSSPADDVGATPEMATVKGWLQALDSSLTSAAFDTIWNRAGNSDAMRAANLTGYLARTLLGASAASVDGATAGSADAMGAISASLSAFTADPTHSARIVDLAGMDGATLARLARTDIGYRYAMSQLDTIAVTGNRSLFAAANIGSMLDRFDPDSGETQLGDAWLDDRGKFLAWNMTRDAGGDLTIDGSQSWTFVDRAKLGADGHALTLKLAGASGDDIQNQVIFGAESSENIKGKSGTDRIYGGGGDDILRGAGGADHLEGGHGDDTVLGGSGDDELAGNQGDDDLDGGRGDDALDGGSGDDTLSGGRGDDLLAGGDGIDSYVFDAGDGMDAIVDADGQGSISLDDAVLTGATSSQNGTWTSTDGRVDYSLEGALTGEGTLTVRAFAAGAVHGESPDNVIHVEHWHNGDLGITLGPAASPGYAPATPAPDSAMSGVDAADAYVSDVPQIDFTDAASAGGAADDPIAQFFDPPSAGGAMVEPISLQQAVASFTGVPIPPDILSGGAIGDTPVVNAVSIADVTGALAGDVAADDLGHESASGMVQMTPDWHMIEPLHLPSDAGPYTKGFGALMARR